MPNFYLNFHTLTLNKKRNKSELHILSNIEDRDVFTLLEQHIGKKLNALIEKKGRVKFLECDADKRIIFGSIATGDKGYTSEFINVDDEKPVYNRKLNDLELIPFYFMLYLPKNSKYCHIAAQNAGVQGPYNILSTLIRGALKNIDATCSLKAVCENGKLIENVLNDNGMVSKIEAYRAKVPEDKAGDYVKKTYVKEVFSGFTPTFMSKIIANTSKSALSDLFLVDDSLDYKLHIKDKRGKKRCLNISSAQATNYDLEDIKLNSQGHPDKDESYKTMYDYIQNISELFQ